MLIISEIETVATLVVVTLFSVSFLWYAVFFLYLKRFVCNVPGPTPLPLIGNWLHMIQPTRLRLSPAKLSPITCYWLGPLGMKPYVYVCDREIIREIATAKKDVFLHRGGRELIAFMCGDSKQSILTSRGETWKKQQSSIGKWLATTAFTTDFFLAHRNANDNLLKLFSSGTDGQWTSIEVSEQVYHHMAETGAKAMFGFKRHPGSQCPHLKKVDDCQRSDAAITFWSIVCVLPFFSTQRWRMILGTKALRKLTGYHQHESSHLEQRKTTQDQLLKTSERPPTLDKLIQLAQSELVTGVAENETVDRLISNIIGLSHGSAKTEAAIVSYALFELARNTAKQKRLRSEIEVFFGEKLPRDIDGLNSMPYLEAVTNECLRLRPAFPVISKIPQHNTTLAGFRISKHAEVTIRVGGIQRDDRYWEHPNRFLPERFLGNQQRCHVFIPFGIGRRVCPGQRAGKVSMKLSLCALIQNFEFRLPHSDYQRQEARSVTVSLKEPMILDVRRHRPESVDGKTPIQNATT